MDASLARWLRMLLGVFIPKAAGCQEPVDMGPGSGGENESQVLSSYMLKLGCPY